MNFWTEAERMRVQKKKKKKKNESTCFTAVDLITCNFVTII